MKVRDYLAIPYILEAQAIEVNGEWTRGSDGEGE